MKIGYLCSDIDVQLYGYEGCSVHIREFTNALVDAGHDVFIICAWAGDDSSRVDTHARVYQLAPSGLNERAWSSIEQEPLVQDHHLERDLRSVLWNYWLQTQGAGIVKREKPDFLYERYALFGWSGQQLSQQFGIPLVLELNAPLCEQQDGYHKFTLTKTAKDMERVILGGADAVIALTQWLKNWAVSLGVQPDGIHILPDAVSERLFAREIDGSAVRIRYGLEGKRVVGFVGSFHWWHDVEGLLGAFAGLHRQNADLRLLLVGDGEQRGELVQSVRSRGLDEAVTFAGKVPHGEVPQHIAAMDVAVVPYGPLEDFFFSPMKLFECMAVGRPTVAAALGQIEEVIEHGQTGWLYPAGDQEKLAEGIETLLRDRELSSRIGAASRNLVLGQYTWKVITSRVLEIAEQLIDQPAVTPYKKIERSEHGSA